MNDLRKVVINHDAELSAKVQRYLFSQGYTWRMGQKHVMYGNKVGLITINDNNQTFGFTEGLVSDIYEEVELTEEVSYVLEPVKVRETIAIGDKNYYLDELEVALENIKPI